jgi:hypothetical protein
MKTEYTNSLLAINKLFTLTEKSLSEATERYDNLEAKYLRHKLKGIMEARDAVTALITTGETV